VSLKSVERAFANDGEPPGAASAELPAANEECPAPNVAQPKPRQDVEAAPRAQEHPAPGVAQPSKPRQDVEAAPQEDIIVLDDSDSGDPTPFIKSGIIQLVRKYSLVFLSVLSH
jgi:hypothetical protein